MTKKMAKSISGLLLLMVLLLTSCTLPQDNSRPGEAVDTAVTRDLAFDGSSRTVPFYAYPYGAKGFSDSLEQDRFLKQEYQDWKEHYVTSSGAGGFLRVQRDYVTYYDTVSEGMGYGLLLAVYFDDQETFDGLFNYTLSHLTENNLMHWRINSNGQEIDEFGLSVYRGLPEHRTEISAYTGQQLPLTGSIDRWLCSATDADLDIAAALIFAWRRWSNTRAASGYYHTAKNMLRSIQEHEIVQWRGSGRYYIAAGAGDWGGSWGNKNGWNPSYVTPAWFRIFDDFMERNDSAYESGFWLQVYIDTVAELSDLNNGCGGKGLFPDWIDTTDPNKPKQSLAQWDGGVSDRGPQSVNCYYDAVRVPWRMALDVSWYGQGGPGFYELNMLDDLANFIASKGGITAIVDGYQPNGLNWNVYLADWNNVHTARNPASQPYNGKYNKRGEAIVIGGQSNSPTFVAMFSSIYMPLNSNARRFAYYHAVSKKEPYGNNHHYFGNTLRLLSLLYLSGNMANLYECEYLPLLAGNITGSQRGWYFIKNNKYGSYLVRDGNTVKLTRTNIVDLDDNAKWGLSDSNNDGVYEVYNWGAIEEGSSIAYLSLSGDNCVMATVRSPNRLWKFLDPDNNTGYYIRPYPLRSSLRMVARNANNEKVNTQSGVEKYWRLIKTPD
jgi:endo-1,4-beta-D-glucanase Y